MEGFIGRSGWKKEVSSKKGIVSGKVSFFWGKGRICQAGYLTSAEGHIPSEVKLQLGQVLGLGLLTWHLAQVTPFWACLFFNNKNWFFKQEICQAFPSWLLC